MERHIKELREEREKSGTTLPLETVLKMRQERSAPLMTAFKEWVEKLLPGVPRTSALGKFQMTDPDGMWIDITDE